MATWEPAQKEPFFWLKLSNSGGPAQNKGVNLRRLERTFLLMMRRKKSVAFSTGAPCFEQNGPVFLDGMGGYLTRVKLV